MREAYIEAERKRATGEDEEPCRIDGGVGLVSRMLPPLELSLMLPRNEKAGMRVEQNEVMKVRVGSAAQAAGLMVGDLIEQVDGSKLDVDHSIVDIISERDIQKCTTFALTVRREAGPLFRAKRAAMLESKRTAKEDKKKADEEEDRIALEKARKKAGSTMVSAQRSLVAERACAISAAEEKPDGAADKVANEVAKTEHRYTSSNTAVTTNGFTNYKHWDHIEVSDDEEDKNLATIERVAHQMQALRRAETENARPAPNVDDVMTGAYR